MNKDKKPEEPGKKKVSTVIYMRVKGRVREALEEEQRRRGGPDVIKLQQIAKEKLIRQIDAEKRRK